MVAHLDALEVMEQGQPTSSLDVSKRKEILACIIQTPTVCCRLSEVDEDSINCSDARCVLQNSNSFRVVHRTGLDGETSDSVDLTARRFLIKHLVCVCADFREAYKEAIRRLS